MHSSREVQDYLLCSECDNLLNQNGESWLIPKLARQDGPFLLLDILEKLPPIEKKGESVAFVAADNPEIDIEKLTHFALGVFWKASVHSWSGTKKESLIDLGPYSDKLRRFLIQAGPYPDHVALVVMVPPRNKQLVAIAQPYRGRTKAFHNFIVYIPGVEFILCVGKGISAEAKMCCVYSNSAHPILVHDVSTKILEWGRMAASTAHKSRRILKTHH
jgi:hypothetical protein